MVHKPNHQCVCAKLVKTTLRATLGYITVSSGLQVLVIGPNVMEDTLVMVKMNIYLATLKYGIYLLLALLASMFLWKILRE